MLQLKAGEVDGGAGPEIVVGCADGRVAVLDGRDTMLGHSAPAAPWTCCGSQTAIATSWDGNVYAPASRPNARD